MTEELTSPSASVSRAPAEAAKAALARHAWREAFDALSEADANGQLQTEDLDLLAQAAWWTGQLPIAIETRERAYGAAVKQGQLDVAVAAAINLGRDNLVRNEITVANAWLSRAARLLEKADDKLGHGWLASTRAFEANLTGDTARSLREATRALEIAEELGDPNLAAYASSEKGSALIAMGQVDEGLALIDEATVSAVGGELDPEVAGGVCCTTIESCAALGDLARAASWTEAQDRWCRREGINGYPGMCRVFRSEIKLLRGSWLEAEAEARQASVELLGFMPAAAGVAHYRIGEIRLLRGDLAAADAALRSAHALGINPEPALSMLRLAEGRVDVAASGIKRALAEGPKLPSWRAPPDSPLFRLPLLRAQVEIAIAAGDVASARSATDELNQIAATFPTPVVHAAAISAQGALLLADGELEAAVRELGRAVDAWTRLAHPYEAARARMLLSEASEATGSAERATMELHAARSTFARLGAAVDLRRADQRLAAVSVPERRSAESASERITRTFAFTDIVDSTRLAELLGDEAWGKLMRWHDQTIRAVVAEYGGEEIKATGDGFFLAFADADAAIDAMIAIQRRLASQRDDQGFAPAVRMGLHTAEATRTGLDYLGIGVNHAARIGAAANGAEILASDATTAAARRSFAELPTRTLHLKGISAPVEVRSIGWR